MPEALTYPGAMWKPLGMQSQPRMKAHNILCYHTMVGYLVSTDGYFRIGNGEGFRGTESHYGVGGIWGPDLKVPGGLDGKTWQWQDRAFSADANLNGSAEVISVETADNAARPIAAWTPKQVDELVRIGAWECSPAAHAACPSSWECRRSGIPAALIPDTRPGRRGIGYHRQGCPPHIVSGGVAWSRSTGKDCPTQVRINQLEREIIPRIRALLVVKPPKPPTPAPTEPTIPPEELLMGMKDNALLAANVPDVKGNKHAYIMFVTEPDGQIVAWHCATWAQQDHLARLLEVPKNDVGTDWLGLDLIKFMSGPLKTPAPATP